MDYKKLQELKDRLDFTNTMVAQVYAHINTMIKAAKMVGVFEQALFDLEQFFREQIHSPLHQLEQDLYDLIGEHAPEVAVKNVTGNIDLKLFGKIVLKPGDEHTLTWSARYSLGVRDLIEEGKLQEVENDG